ncbi:hypothetical protein GcM1_229044 [Golovinomyces cichoracearum]|uniref:Uncharacterized protein n=1 Tax=Golovinomyces cichoracearum TaxID=62708 RepID=A0A420INJ1_9PEZI|nr:hypothetical protein GcM1_229044 [Golovinomyces cichoracearum]
MKNIDGDVDMLSPEPRQHAAPPPSSSPNPLTTNNRGKTRIPPGNESEKTVPARQDGPSATQTPIYLTKSIEDAVEQARHLTLKRESVAKEYARALDEVTNYLNDAGALYEASKLTLALARALQQFFKGFENLDSVDISKFSYNTSPNPQPSKSCVALTYAQAEKSHVIKYI